MLGIDPTQLAIHMMQAKLMDLSIQGLILAEVIQLATQEMLLRLMRTLTLTRVLARVLLLILNMTLADIQLGATV
nr:hypothetical protein BaRGS_022891 [Batillaria attramentaria]